VGGLAVSSAGLSQAELSDLDPRKLGVPAHRSEDSEAPRWRRRKKHTFIVSSAGKPIFTRYGDEDALNPLFGVMCSLVSFFVEGEDDTPRAVLAGDHRVVFLIRGPVYLIMVSRTKEPTAHLARQLQFVYTQLVSILTRKGLERVFKKRHGFDLRNLLGSSGEQVLSNLVGAMDAHKLASALPLHSAISFVFGAPHCARLPLAVRSQVNRALLSVRSPNLIYAILLARTQLVQFVRPRKTALWAEDLLLVVNLVNSSSSFRESDGTWTPLCLPLYSPDVRAHPLTLSFFIHPHKLTESACDFRLMSSHILAFCTSMKRRTSVLCLSRRATTSLGCSPRAKTKLRTHCTPQERLRASKRRPISRHSLWRNCKQHHSASRVSFSTLCTFRRA
jgi:hypothetical protein